MKRSLGIETSCFNESNRGNDNINTPSTNRDNRAVTLCINDCNLEEGFEGFEVLSLLELEESSSSGYSGSISSNKNNFNTNHDTIFNPTTTPTTSSRRHQIPGITEKPSFDVIAEFTKSSNSIHDRFFTPSALGEQEEGGEEGEGRYVTPESNRSSDYEDVAGTSGGNFVTPRNSNEQEKNISYSSGSCDCFDRKTKLGSAMDHDNYNVDFIGHQERKLMINHHHHHETHHVYRQSHEQSYGQHRSYSGIGSDQQSDSSGSSRHVRMISNSDLFEPEMLDVPPPPPPVATKTKMEIIEPSHQYPQWHQQKKSYRRSPPPPRPRVEEGSYSPIRAAHMMPHPRSASLDSGSSSTSTPHSTRSNFRSPPRFVRSAEERQQQEEHISPLRSSHHHHGHYGYAKESVHPEEARYLERNIQHQQHQHYSNYARESNRNASSNGMYATGSSPSFDTKVDPHHYQRDPYSHQQINMGPPRHGSTGALDYVQESQAVNQYQDKRYEKRDRGYHLSYNNHHRPEGEEAANVISPRYDTPCGTPQTTHSTSPCRSYARHGRLHHYDRHNPHEKSAPPQPLQHNKSFDSMGSGYNSTPNHYSRTHPHHHRQVHQYPPEQQWSNSSTIPVTTTTSAFYNECDTPSSASRHPNHAEAIACAASYDNSASFDNSEVTSSKGGRFSPIYPLSSTSYDQQQISPKNPYQDPKLGPDVDLERIRELTADPSLATANMLPPSTKPDVLDISAVNDNDVLCGRGGGTNSQVGNRRFRSVVTQHQPVYLTAKRREKPLIARAIVECIRNKGGRFLKRNEETKEMFDVGDEKAEAKTSQALREGLEVRATKAAPTGLLSGVAPPRRRKKRVSQTGATKTSDAEKGTEINETRTPESPTEKRLQTPSPHSQISPKEEQEERVFHFSNGVSIPHSPLKKKMKTPTRDKGVILSLEEPAKMVSEHDRILLQDFSPPLLTKNPAKGRKEEEIDIHQEQNKGEKDIKQEENKAITSKIKSIAKIKVESPRKQHPLGPSTWQEV